ncbi:4a-hydroxytetrahydrobiopterin dehydratase [candidate division KSB1 bacterium]|nr:4a-hydroxytetrahydrobiopterin dehydratase [candidate division KSB1 bacterium]
MALLDEKTLRVRMKEAGQWRRRGKKLEKSVVCKNFRQALDYVNRIGELAEKADHHPDLMITDWNRVSIVLSTHSQGGLTEKDFSLAKQIDELEF